MFFCHCYLYLQILVKLKVVSADLAQLPSDQTLVTDLVLHSDQTLGSDLSLLVRDRLPLEVQGHQRQMVGGQALLLKDLVLKVVSIIYQLSAPTLGSDLSLLVRDRLPLEVPGHQCQLVEGQALLPKDLVLKVVSIYTLLFILV